MPALYRRDDNRSPDENEKVGSRQTTLGLQVQQHRNAAKDEFTFRLAIGLLVGEIGRGPDFDERHDNRSPPAKRLGECEQIGVVDLDSPG
jgi:hypothetical protein